MGLIMAFTQGQITGSVVALVIFTLIYIVSLFSPLYHQETNSIPFLAGNSSSVAIELAGDGINNNGIYFLPEGTKVIDFLKKVNVELPRGFLDKSSEIKLLPGNSILILRSGALPPQIILKEMKAARRIALGLPIDINYASSEEIKLVPGIGEKTVAHIISLRETSGRIHHLDELMKIKGIKKKRLSKLKKYFYVNELRLK